MKYVVAIIIIASGISCAQNNRKEITAGVNPGATVDFDWLIGNWIRTNDKEDQLTYEYWTKRSKVEYMGWGYTLQQADTIFKEHLRLIKIDNLWNFEVSGVNESPTNFQLTDISENSFLCENKNNDFPKQIEYAGDEDILLAKISDSTTVISFSFQKILPK
jgi:hypothetical protein